MEFGFAVDVIPDVVVVDLCAAGGDEAGQFDEEGDGDRVAATLAEDFAAFSS